MLEKAFINGFKEKETFCSKKGRKHFAFFFFSFQTRKDLALVKSTMQRFDIFLKLLENLQENVCDEDYF